jgi:hypothetical protein
MHLKNIFNEIHQTAEAPTTSLFNFQFYLGGKVLQAELRRTLTEKNFTQLLELKAFSIKPIFLSSQIFSIIIRKYLHSLLDIYIIDNLSIGQHISSIYKVSQKYHNFNLQRNYKDFKLWVTEKLLMVKLSIKDKSKSFLDNFKDIYGEINQLRYFQKCYGSLIMTLDLSINPVREKLFQDYLHECQILLTEVPNLAEKMTIYLIQNDEHWYPGHINVDVPMTTNIFMKSNFSNQVKNGTCAKVQVINIGNLIDSLNFKEIGTKNYWINNTPTKLNLMRIYKNSDLYIM